MNALTGSELQTDANKKAEGVKKAEEKYLKIISNSPHRTPQDPIPFSILCTRKGPSKMRAE